MKYVILALALFLSSCSTPRDVPDQFEPYIQSFINDAKTFNIEVSEDHLTVGFGDPGAGHDGNCDTNMNKITIRGSVWDNSDEVQRSILIKHELGHCLLGRQHRLDVLADGRPASIMYPTALSESAYLAHTSDYINELYTHKD